MKLINARRKIARGIYRWSDGTWEVFLRVSPLPLVHRRLPPDRFDDLRKVRTWIDSQRADMRRQAASMSAPRGTLAADAEAFLKLLASRPRLQRERRAQLALWIDAFGPRPRQAIRAPEIQQVLAQWAEQGYSYSTIKHRRDALLGLYRELDRGSDARNPVLDTSVPVPKPNPEPRGQPLDVVLAILDAVSDQGGVHGRTRNDVSRARIRIHVMAHTGMRPAELRRYRPPDWHHSLHQLVIRAAKDSNNRVIPLTPEAERWLLELERADAIGDFDNGVIERAFHRALVKVGLAPKERVKGARTGPRKRTGLIRPYDLRHSLLTELTLQTGSTDAAQWMGGHKDPRMTQRYNLNAVPVVMRAAADKVAEAFRRARKQA